MAVRTYDPREVIVSFGAPGSGGVQIVGYADGTYINVQPQDDAYASVSGADGEVARARSNDGRAQIAITLMQTSDSNDYLSGLYNADRAGNTGVRAMSIVERGSGRTIIASASAWVARLPDVGYSKGVETREWRIDTAGMAWFIGGNNSEGAAA